ncbi:MAG: hypothetical protein HQK52_15920 [Oligoflexia bacterium]|nr:hypothetical protein [Oligoflexia bacterium]
MASLLFQKFLYEHNISAPMVIKSNAGYFVEEHSSGFLSHAISSAQGNILRMETLPLVVFEDWGAQLPNFYGDISSVDLLMVIIVMKMFLWSSKVAL